MICPNCNHLNPKGILFCEECKAFLPDAIPDPYPDPVAEPIAEPIAQSLAPAEPVVAPFTPPAPVVAADPAPPLAPSPFTTGGTGPAGTAPLPPVFEDSPFGDFLPAWMAPKPPQPAPAASAPAWPPPSAPAASLSVDALLQSPNGHAPAVPTTPPPFTTGGNGPAVAAFNRPEAPLPLSDPTGGLPVPAFQLPPLWYKQAVEMPWQEIRTALGPRAVPSNSISEGYNPGLAGPETRHDALSAQPTGPEYGVDRGFYFFSDSQGNIVVHALAGFGRRLVGAFVDSIISAILGVIFFYLVVVLFLNLAKGDYTQSLLGVTLALVILPVLFGFLYHAILVGLTGQTVGDRLVKIKVIRRGGRAVGLVSGVVRALYGLAPSLIVSIIRLVLPASAAVPANLISGSIGVLTAFGMAWALFDKGRQGWHDKLADTYVVSVKES